MKNNKNLKIKQNLAKKSKFCNSRTETEIENMVFKNNFSVSKNSSNNNTIYSAPSEGNNEILICNNSIHLINSSINENSENDFSSYYDFSNISCDEAKKKRKKEKKSGFSSSNKNDDYSHTKDTNFVHSEVDCDSSVGKMVYKNNLNNSSVTDVIDLIEANDESSEQDFFNFEENINLLKNEEKNIANSNNIDNLIKNLNTKAIKEENKNILLFEKEACFINDQNSVVCDSFRYTNSIIEETFSDIDLDEFTKNDNKSLIGDFDNKSLLKTKRGRTKNNFSVKAAVDKLKDIFIAKEGKPTKKEEICKKVKKRNIFKVVKNS